ncbi:MAG: element excision factor XisH family protein, partial [Rhizonema sp. PD37]|nr:element excision factor XisH family protein [Rhizonema sp. PD37]
MPAKDIYHNVVRFALVKDGWNILTENYTLEYGGDHLYVDIAAEKSIAAEKQGHAAKGGKAEGRGQRAEG